VKVKKGKRSLAGISRERPIDRSLWASVKKRTGMVRSTRLLLHLMLRRPQSHAGDQALVAVDTYLLAV
jgi:hypothetical protein